MRDDLTVIYYTSNREKEDFEQKIRDNLLKVIGNLPLISVSQKPLKNFGMNICVGDVGVSEFNLYKQMYLGLRAVKTKYFCTAEADCLYPPTGYFDFVPPDDFMAYMYTNLHILWKGRNYFKKKGYSLCALFANKDYMRRRFHKSLSGFDFDWNPTFRHIKTPLFYRSHGWKPFENDLSVINIKTGDGTRWTTGTYGGKVETLPFWGCAKELGEDLWQKK